MVGLSAGRAGRSEDAEKGLMRHCIFRYADKLIHTVGSVTGTLYSDTTYGYGTTACSNQTCYVKVKHGGTTSGWANSYGYASCKNSATNGTTNAQSWHRTASTSSFSLYF